MKSGPDKGFLVKDPEGKILSCVHFTRKGFNGESCRRLSFAGEESQGVAFKHWKPKRYPSFVPRYKEKVEETLSHK
jgi:hypothetical protein